MDVVIPTAEKDIFTLGKALPYIDKNLDHPHVYIITKPNCFRYFSSFKNIRIQCINENDLIAGLSYEAVKKCMKDNYMTSQSVGWYFQQFLKMAFSLSHYVKDYYVVWDSDTIPLSPISFVDESRAFSFNLKSEYHLPYFECIDRILGLKKMVDLSFITEHMAISSEIMRNLIVDIEQYCLEKGSWWQKIIYSQPSDVFAGFSEYETYGTYMMTYYPDQVKIRELRTNREGREQYGMCVTKYDLHHARKNYDTISFERRIDTKPHSPQRRVAEWIYFKYCALLRRYYKII